MNIILLTVVFMLGGGKATINIEFDSMEKCQAELMSYIAYLKAADIKPIKAGCSSISITKK